MLSHVEPTRRALLTFIRDHLIHGALSPLTTVLEAEIWLSVPDLLLVWLQDGLDDELRLGIAVRSAGIFRSAGCPLRIEVDGLAIIILHAVYYYPERRLFVLVIRILVTINRQYPSFSRTASDDSQQNRY